MKILITGSQGQLGTEWMEYLKTTSHNVRGLGSADLDITRRDDVHKIVADEQPDLLVNCAAFTAVDKAEVKENEAYMVNEIGVQNLARACNRNDVKLLHYSTDYVFEGSPADQERLPDGYDEEYPPNPQNVYGKSKRGGEVAIENVCDDWIIIRVSWLCGQYGNNFVKTMLRLSKERKTLDVVNDQTGSPTFCFDVVEKSMKLAGQDQRGYFHISSSGTTTWFDITRQLLQLNGSKTALNSVSSAQFNAKAKRPAFSLLNTGKIESLSLEPVHWKDGLETLYHQLSNSNHL
ncbi:MAG: dTDP-4-dehydrorhamnose reductase [Balneolaceae bacterium]